MEVIADDPRVRQRGTDRLAVGVVWVDRDHLDPGADLRRQRAEPALDGAPVAPVEHLDHAPAVQVRDDGGPLVAAAVVGLVERQPPRPPADVARLEPVGSVGERAYDVVAAGAFLARNLRVRGAVDDALGQPPTEAPSHPLTGRQPLIGLGERAPALGAAVAALAPHQPVTRPAIGRSRTRTRGRSFTRSSLPPQ
jgi:hypothetical protein